MARGRGDNRPPGTPGGSSERPALFFADAAEFRRWLEDNHASATELWMGLYKKHVTARGLTWDDAVPEALCFGWIDSVIQRIDDDAVRQRWTPRKKSSTWSAVNVDHVERLIAQGRMHPAGLAAYHARRPDRTGIYSYENPPESLPDAYVAALAAVPVAQAFWDAATASYRRTVISWVVRAAHQQTRDRRMQQLIDDCAAGRLVPPQRYGTEPVWAAKARADLGLPDTT